jgi:hypothetical protein
LPFLEPQSVLEQKIQQLHQWTLRPRKFIEGEDRGGLERGIDDIRTFLKASLRLERNLVSKYEWEELSHMLISILGFAVLMGISFDSSDDWKGKACIEGYSQSLVKTARRDRGLTLSDVGNEKNPTLNEFCRAAVFLVENCAESFVFVGDFAPCDLKVALGVVRWRPEW